MSGVSNVGSSGGNTGSSGLKVRSESVSVFGVEGSGRSGEVDDVIGAGSGVLAVEDENWSWSC